MRIVASIIYHFFMDYFRGMEIVPNNQNHLGVDIRLKAVKVVVKLDQRSPSQTKKLKPGEEAELYEDVFTKEDLREIFVVKKAKFEKCKGMVENFIEQVEDVVGRVWDVKAKDQRKEDEEAEAEEREKIMKILKRNKIVLPAG